MLCKRPAEPLGAAPLGEGGNLKAGGVATGWGSAASTPREDFSHWAGVLKRTFASTRVGSVARCLC